MAEITFLSLFEREQDKLRSSIEGCTLPKDSQKIQTIVSQYLSKMFDSDGELRMNLTQSEDYILQAAISLLNAQQQMAAKMSDYVSSTTGVASEPTSTSASTTFGRTKTTSSKADALMSRNVSAAHALGGSAIGSIGGGLLFGTWGAVFGAIAGTALVLYVSSSPEEKIEEVKPLPQLKASVETPIDVNQYLNIIRNICKSLDSLIDTFRAQIRRVAQNYESFKERTLEDDFSDLLENIQTLIGICDSHTTLGVPSRIASKVEDIEDVLGGYGLTVVRYDEETEKYFNSVSSPNVKELVVANPAILRDGKVIIKGKIFVPSIL